MVQNMALEQISVQ